MNTPAPASTCPARQRGATLIEALVAFVLLAIGAIAVAQLQGQLRLHADTARQRSEAARLGERELENLRAYSVLAAASGLRSYDAIVDGETVVDGTSGYESSASYRILRRVDDAALAGAKVASVAVGWTDRSGAAQGVVFDTVIARSDPAYSGALALGAGAGTPRGAFGRSRLVPAGAKPLGDGRSVWKPATAGGAALIFDDASGDIVGRCSGIGAATRDLAASDLTACAAGAWRLLAGTIRFSSAAPPLASQASETPPGVAVALTLAAGTYPADPDCSAEPMKTVRYSAGGSVHFDAVAIDATPASAGLATWDDTGDRFVAYRCIVTPRADGRWSGRTTLLPSGWTMGTGDGDRRVCRFATDRDASGAIDANIEHPADYADVGGALQAQNFLVVRGSQACPAAPDAGIINASLGTVQHQP